MRRVSRSALAGTALSAVAVAALLNTIGPSAPGRAAYAPHPSASPTATHGTPAAAFTRVDRSAERSHSADRLDRSADRPDITASTSRSHALSQQSEKIAKAAKAAKKEAERKAAAKRAAAKRRRIARLGYDPATAQTPQEIARAMMANKYGWGAGEYSCFNRVVMSESGWSVTATNPSSGAYGIMQALPASKMASAGSDWRTNPATQIRWGLSYIQRAYGTPCSAWSFHLSHGWY